MALFTASVLILPHPVPATDVFAVVHGHLASLGAAGVPDFLVLNDLGDQEADPVDECTPEQAWQHLLAWPALGGVSYTLGAARFTVFLTGVLPHQVDAVTLGIEARLLAHDPAARAVFDRLSSELHALLRAARTITASDLVPGHWEHDEVARVRLGVFTGQYERDLRALPS